MGTNYYLRYIPKEEDLQKIKEADNTLYYFLKNRLDKNDGIADEIHIGKSGGGLDMEKGAECNRQNAYTLIREHIDNGYELVDEYGEKVPINEFIALVDSKTATINHYEDGRPDFENDGARWIDVWFC